LFWGYLVAYPKHFIAKYFWPEFSPQYLNKWGMRDFMTSLFSHCPCRGKRKLFLSSVECLVVSDR
jgi:hypothetical protein